MCEWNYRRIGGDACDTISREQDARGGLKPTRMPRLAHQRTVIEVPGHRKEPCGNPPVEDRRRRELHQQWAALLPEPGRLLEERRKRHGSATVDERGQYRVWGLAPGKYQLSVDYTNAGYTISVTGVLLSLGNGRPLYVPETWAKTYFPGTPDADKAAIVEVGEGASVERLDFGISNRQ